jgi:hypothetical protein
VLTQRYLSAHLDAALQPKLNDEEKLNARSRTQAGVKKWPASKRFVSPIC